MEIFPLVQQCHVEQQSLASAPASGFEMPQNGGLELEPGFSITARAPSCLIEGLPLPVGRALQWLEALFQNLHSEEIPLSPLG